MRFPYSAWAKAVSAQCMQSDLDCGFEVADHTPNPELAREAVASLIRRLRKESLAPLEKYEEANRTRGDAND